MTRCLVVVLALTACQPDLFVDKEKEPIRHEQRIPVTLNRKLDVLWVVDNSGAMAPAQTALAAGIPTFLELLYLVEGGLPDLHMGFVSSNVGTAPVGNDPKCADQGDDGILQLPESCPALTDGSRYIVDVATADSDPSQRSFNYTGSLEDQLGCMAQIGIQGCAWEQHLESMRRALDNDVENAGFLRRDAHLAVVFVQDEDDCSAFDRNVFDPIDDSVDSPLGELSSFRCFEFGTTCEGVSPDEERTPGAREGCRPDEESPYIEPPSAYVRFLEELKGDPDKLVVAAIAGPPGPVTVGIDEEKANERWLEPACLICPDGPAGVGDCSPYPTASEAALVGGYPSIRMSSFAEAFAGRSAMENICRYSESSGALDFRPQLRRIGGLIRRAIGTACLEAELVEGCVVTDIRPGGSSVEIRSCDESGPPCYRFVQDRELCPYPDLYPSGLRIEVDRGAIEPADGTVVEISCPLPG